MKRTIYDEDHLLFRDAFRSFLSHEVLPRQEAWREAGVVDRELWRKAGEAGFLCPELEEEYGGSGGDFLHAAIVMEELARAHESGFALPLHSDVVVPYIHRFGDEAQKQRWLPGCASGEFVTAIAMTEPGTGSDLAAVATTAKREGDEYILDGSKTFISNGMLADLCVVAARTPEASDDPHGQLSLFVVESEREGYLEPRKLKKMGLASQDTAELAFDGCRVPVSNRLGPEGAGFLMLMQNLQQERLVVAIGAQAAAEQALEEAVTYANERKAFGRSIARFQALQFSLVDQATKIEVGRAFLDALVVRHAAGEELVKECSMAKLWQTEMLGEVVDACLQVYGGYGYMDEYPISRDYVDARVQRIFAGTSEIMKLIIARRMGLGA
ncbi:MAG: acyl-CoA dehydrogenase [Deltaproteobacteria bacterium]|nr:acyl-CoA dehydrogenase [Deltaproteobacteria bacterium]